MTQPTEPGAHRWVYFASGFWLEDQGRANGPTRTVIGLGHAITSAEDIQEVEAIMLRYARNALPDKYRPDNVVLMHFQLLREE